MQVFFSPKGGCTAAIVAAVGKAKSSVLVQAYSFTSPEIVVALIAAHQRGVAVQAILDKREQYDATITTLNKYTKLAVLAAAGVPVKLDFRHLIAHNKVMVLDGATVITGSFNFTQEAESSNAENLLVIRDKQLAAAYTNNWQAHAAHSVDYVP